jgi:hypothetical protein
MPLAFTSHCPERPISHLVSDFIFMFPVILIALCLALHYAIDSLYFDTELVSLSLD